METVQFCGLECIEISNEFLQIVVSKSVGPRILSLRYCGGKNLLAELPAFTFDRPDGKAYHFYGGHRLWLAPEDPMRSYGLDDRPVEITQSNEGLSLRKLFEPETEVEKSILLQLDPEKAKLTLVHRVTNLGSATIELSPWAITQFRLGGVAILPQTQPQPGLLPSRFFTFWPYTNIKSPCMDYGDEFLLLGAEEQPPYKVGFPNPHGWMAYWLDGVLFVKKADYDPQEKYCDFGVSSECYCNHWFMELETLGPLKAIEPGSSLTHTESWEVFSDIPRPESEDMARNISDRIGLE